VRHDYLFIWLPECALIAAVLWIGHAISLGLSVALATVAWPAVSWAVVRIGSRSHLPDGGQTGRFVASIAGWLLAWAIYEWRLTGHFSRIQFAMAAYILLALAALRWWRAPAPARAMGESCRLMAVAAAGLWLTRSFLSPAFYGAGDAQTYANMTADMQEQVRAGVFPVFVGQSEYQFNGAIYPVRIAPAFHYLGAFLDAATLRALDPDALQNLLLATLGAARPALAGLPVCLPFPRLSGSARAALRWRFVYELDDGPLGSARHLCRGTLLSGAGFWHDGMPGRRARAALVGAYTRGGLDDGLGGPLANFASAHPSAGLVPSLAGGGWPRNLSPDRCLPIDFRSDVSLRDVLFAHAR
jgi:hypothetical protein